MTKKAGRYLDLCLSSYHMAASEFVECTINDAILKIIRRRKYAGRAIAVSGASKAVRVAPPADPRALVLAPAPSEAAVAAAEMQTPGMSDAGQSQDRDKARETGGLEDESSEDDEGEEEGAAPGPKPARRRSKSKKTRRHG
jgi:hypothetical protein